MIVTIDGPSGSGKSTAAKRLAERLGFEFLDTGAMFRTIALALMRRDIDAKSCDEDIEPLLPHISIDVQPGRIWLNGEEVTHLIRTPEVSSGASKVAVFSCVRRFLAAQQRHVAHGRNMICEGRDQGTVVFPDALVKFFVTASPAARAERRFQELRAKGDPTTFDEVLHALMERDDRDSTRAIAPLMAADDALVLDTSSMALNDVIDFMEREIRRCLRG